MSIITLKRVERRKTWGVIDRKTGQYKEKYDNCADKFVPALRVKIGGIRTGLTKEQEVKFEEAMSLEKGDLNPNGKFWDNFSIIIPEDGLRLDTSETLDELKFLVLSADPEVVTDVSEVDVSPSAMYVMYTEGEKAKSKNSKRDIIANAYAKFANMTPSEIVEALYMFGKDADHTDLEICRDTVGDIVEKDPEKFLSVLDDRKFKDKVFLIRAVKAGIIRKLTVGTGFNQPLYFGDIPLGKGLDEAIDFLLNKENQNVYVGLQKAFNAFKKDKE